MKKIKSKRFAIVNLKNAKCEIPNTLKINGRLIIKQQSSILPKMIIARTMEVYNASKPFVDRIACEFITFDVNPWLIFKFNLWLSVIDFTDRIMLMDFYRVFQKGYIPWEQEMRDMGIKFSIVGKDLLLNKDRGENENK